MDNLQLRNELIGAAQDRRFDDLIKLIDDHQPDFSNDDFKIKVKHSVRKEINLLYKNVNQITISGQVSSSTASGYQLAIPQQFACKKGIFNLSHTGLWTYTITNQQMIDKISNKESVVINDKVGFSYFKDVTINSAGSTVSAYIAAFCSHADMEKILSLGCCPNSSNTNSQEIGLSATSKFSNHQATPSKLSNDSRPLINATRRGCIDMVNVLINYSCDCCSGSGAKATDNIIELAVAGSDVHSALLKNKLDTEA
jgi:hypothetical protein